MRAQHSTKQWRHKAKMHSELDPKPAFIKTLCFCPRMATNRQFPSSQRSVWAHQKHSWACNLLKNGCSVSSLEWETPPAWEWVLLNNAASKAWPALPLPPHFPDPVSALHKALHSQKTWKKAKTHVFSPLELPTLAEGRRQDHRALSMQGRVRPRQFGLKFHKVRPVCSKVGWSPLIIKNPTFYSRYCNRNWLHCYLAAAQAAAGSGGKRSCRQKVWPQFRCANPATPTGCQGTLQGLQQPHHPPASPV